jgi:hypothetical protein
VPRDVSFLSRAARRFSPSTPYARAAHRADHRFVLRPVVRVGRGSTVPRRNLRRHPVVTVGRALYLGPPSSPSRPSPPLMPAPPRHHSRRRRARISMPLQCRVNPLGISPSSLGPNRTAPCPGRAPSRRQRHPPRPPPPVPTVHPRRRPLHPNFGHHRALGEHVVESHHLPGRERRRFAGIGRNRAAPTAKGHIARAHFFPWCFV